MAIKIQYPVQLHADTKCPSCQQPIISMGQNMYVCQTGHVIEGLVLVTMRPRSKQEPAKASVDQEPLTPAYDKDIAKEDPRPRILPAKKETMQ
jgi:hypothetical protein